MTDAVVSPFLSADGRIVVPSALLTLLSPAQLDAILAHEQAHRRRGDHWYFPCLAWLDALLWYNPFLRRQIKRCHLAAEIACDAAATGDGHQARLAYARALVGVLRLADRRGDVAVPALGSNHPSGDYRMRLTHIMGRHTTTPHAQRTRLLAVMLAPLMAAQLAYAAGEVDFTVPPLDGRLTSGYGMSADPFADGRRRHRGVDIAAAAGTPIVAPAAGTVRRLRRSDQGYGNVLEIDHGKGYVTRYAQLQSFAVAEGDRVTAGDVIARVGSSGRSTGPHLHLEVLRDGQRIDPATVIDLPIE